MAFHIFWKNNTEKERENNKYSFLSCKLVPVLVKVLHFLWVPDLAYNLCGMFLSLSLCASLCSLLKHNYPTKTLSSPPLKWAEQALATKIGWAPKIVNSVENISWSSFHSRVSSSHSYFQNSRFLCQNFVSVVVSVSFNTDYTPQQFYIISVIPLSESNNSNPLSFSLKSL